MVEEGEDSMRRHHRRGIFEDLYLVSLYYAMVIARYTKADTKQWGTLSQQLLITRADLWFLIANWATGTMQKLLLTNLIHPDFDFQLNNLTCSSSFHVHVDHASRRFVNELREWRWYFKGSTYSCLSPTCRWAYIYK